MFQLNISTSRLSRSGSTSSSVTPSPVSSTASPITPASATSALSLSKRMNPFARATRGSEVTLSSVNEFAEDMDDDNVAWGKTRS